MTTTKKVSHLDQLQAQELQHLITVSTGFVDAYIIECHHKVPMLLPQNIVLSAFDSVTNVKTVEWHTNELPVYHLNDPCLSKGVVLVIEAEEEDQRFALMCRAMPEAIRIRISEVVDEANERHDLSIFQYVRVGEALYHVPNLDYIQKQLVFG